MSHERQGDANACRNAFTRKAQTVKLIQVTEFYSRGLTATYT